MAHYPDARKPGPKDIPRIERDDFPAPPFAYSDPDRRRRWSESSKGFEGTGPDYVDGIRARGGGRRPSTGDGDQVDSNYEDDGNLLGNLEDGGEYLEADPQLKREEQELSKISTGIGQVFLKSIKEREKVRAWKLAHLDPRNASRNPSAKTEIPTRLRYENPVNACELFKSSSFQWCIIQWCSVVELQATNHLN